MRMLLKVTIPVEAGNAAVKNGTLGATIGQILGELKPEAAYFVTEKGQRTGMIVFDMQHQSELPAIAEPWFLAFNADISIQPAMKPEDLAAAGPAFEHTIKTYVK
jgi:hypothetical protein